MDPETIDRDYVALQRQSQQTAALIQAGRVNPSWPRGDGSIWPRLSRLKSWSDGDDLLRHDAGTTRAELP